MVTLIIQFQAFKDISSKMGKQLIHLPNKEIRNDVAVLKKIVFCNLLRHFPHYTIKMKFCVLSFLWLIWNSAFGIWLLKQILENEKKITTIRLSTSQSVTLITIGVSTSWGALMHQENLRIFLENIIEVNSLLGNKWNKSSRSFNTYLKIFFHHVILFLLISKDFLNEKMSIKKYSSLPKYLKIYMFLLNYQIFIIMIATDTLE